MQLFGKHKTNGRSSLFTQALDRPSRDQLLDVIGEGPQAQEARGSSLAEPDDWLVEAWIGKQAASGITVNETTALNFTSVYGAVRILAEGISALPLPVYRRKQPRGKERDFSHPLYEILHDSPNPEITSLEFRETLQGHLCLWGNAYAEIERSMGGEVKGLWPLLPNKMIVRREKGQLVYEYDVGKGPAARLPADRILHLRGLSSNGIMGYSPIGLAREAIGLGLATEEFGARLFSNDATPRGVLEHPKKLNRESEDNLKRSWYEAHGGLKKSHRLAVLEEGMKYHQISIPPEHAQFLQTRNFQVAEIARMFKVPLHMLANLDNATFSNIEHQGLEFVTYSLMPWLVRWEQRIKLSLFTKAERRAGLFAEHVVAALLRGDIKSRFEAYAVARNNGWMSADDIRELENLNPIGEENGGDDYLRPLNMVVAGEDQEPPAAARSTSHRSEARGLRSSTARRRLSQAFRGMFVDAAARIVRRERTDVLKEATKSLAQRGQAEFDLWLEEFYRKHRVFVRKQMAPLYASYAEAIQKEAAEEVSAAVGMTPELEKFTDDYLESFTTRHIDSSKGQIRKIVRESKGDPMPALEKRLDEWGEKRPGKIADWETVRSGNAVAKAVFVGAGITRLRSRAFGDNCPYCEELDGQVIGIEQNFINAGEDFQPEGVDKPLTTSGSVAHAPYHEGCDCAVEAD